MLLDMARGVDPRKALQAARLYKVRETFSAVAELFLARHVSTLKSHREITLVFQRVILPALGHMPVASITRRDVVALIESKGGTPYQARHLFAYLSKFFAWAIAKDRYDLALSPCIGIKVSELVGKALPRQRVLTDDELLAVWTAAGRFGYPAAPFVRLLILSGQRLREVADMSWGEIDLERSLWTIPPVRMKGDAAHEVPLPPMAVELLKSLPRWDGPFVFSTTGGRRPISGFSKMKSRIDAAMQAPMAPWRFHDLRRTMLRHGWAADSF